MTNDSSWRPTTPVMSSVERRDAALLIVESSLGLRSSLRQLLAALGFYNTSEASDPVTALKKIEERNFTHVIFESNHPRMGGQEFLQKILEIDSTLIAIPTSESPSVDEVFELLMRGAKSFLVKPFSSSNIDDAIVMASKGEPLSEAVLTAKNRNDALAALMMTNLDRLAIIMKQARQFDTARRELPKRDLVFRRSVNVGMTFADGGPAALRDAVVSFCLERSSGPATRLGRLRSKLKPKKKEPKGPRSSQQDASELEEGELPELHPAP